MTENSNNQKFNLFEIITAIFVGILIVSNIVSQKFFDFTFLGFTMSLDSGTLLLFPVLYIFGDVVPEVYGYHASRRLIWYGFGANVLAAFLFKLSIMLPHSEYFTYQDAFSLVLGNVTGLVLASMGGYLVGSFINSFIMAHMKTWMIRKDPSHKFLFVRTIASTFAGEFFDTAIFVGIATFLFKIFPPEIYISLVLTQWLLKSLIETSFTPVTLYIIRKVKKYENMDIVGTDSYNPFAVNKSGGTNLKQNNKK
ncbi:MAG: queuosine precursor transporter [Spirochaetes bacterium]|nr:queuosine precursor transporter [Spirochaetota bacterium]